MEIIFPYCNTFMMVPSWFCGSGGLLRRSAVQSLLPSQHAEVSLGNVPNSKLPLMLLSVCECVSERSSVYAWKQCANMSSSMHIHISHSCFIKDTHLSASFRGCGGWGHWIWEYERSRMTLYRKKVKIIMFYVLFTWFKGLTYKNTATTCFLQFIWSLHCLTFGWTYWDVHS